MVEFCRQVRDVQRDVIEHHGFGSVRNALYGWRHVWGGGWAATWSASMSRVDAWIIFAFVPWSAKRIAQLRGNVATSVHQSQTRVVSISCVIESVGWLVVGFIHDRFLAESDSVQLMCIESRLTEGLTFAGRADSGVGESNSNLGVSVWIV